MGPSADALAAVRKAGEGSSNAHPVLLKGLNRFLGNPRSRFLEGLLTGKHFLPEDLSFSRPTKFNGAVKHPDRRSPDVGAGAVAYSL